MPDGFLVSPAKGPLQNIIIQNLSDHAHVYTLTPVATAMSGKFCEPTGVPVSWLHVAARVRVPAHKSVSVPVSVSGTHATPVDVAVKVQPATRASDHLGVAYVSYAQEIIGGLHGSGCAHLKGTAPVAVKAPQSHAGSFPVFDIGVAVVVVALAILATLRVIRKRGPKGRHS